MSRRLVPIVLALAGLAAAFVPAPSYRRLSLWELAAYADVIATGEIVRVDTETFEFRVDEALLGTQPSAMLTVRRFQDWTCHGRWTRYAVGQRLMVFLRRSKGDPNMLAVMGGGDEGELPFVEESVVAENSHNFKVRGFAVDTHRPAGEPMVGTRLPIAELSAAVLGFRDVFIWTGDRGVSPRRTLAEVRAFGDSSRIARHMFEEAYSSRGWRGPVDPALRTLDLETVPRIVEGEFPGVSRDRWSPSGSGGTRPAWLDSWFGESLAMPGDVDGDGIPDLLVGAQRDSLTGHHHGAAWMLFMDRSGAVRSALELREQNPGLLPPMNEWSRFGTAVAALGDLDGDGVPDIVVGAPGWGGLQRGRGGVWILFMKRSGAIARAVEIGASQHLSELGVGEGSGLGASIALLGDLGGDGTVEVAIGQEPRFDLDFGDGRAVFVVSLASDGSVVRANRIHGREDGFEGANWFGDALCAIGDVNGDGITDLAIGDSGDHDGGQIRGAVWVTLLGPDGSLRGQQKISDWVGGFEGRLVDWSRFGSSLAAPGDIDADGVPDILVASAEGIWTLALHRDGTVRRFEFTQLTVGDADRAPRLGRSLAFSGPAVSGGDAFLATGGSLWRGPDSENCVWWLTLGPGGGLVGR